MYEHPETIPERTVLEDLQGVYSDLHKDVYGFRPRTVPTECWNNETWLRNEIEVLDIELGHVIERENAEHDECEKNFYLQLDKLIEAGAGDRATAFRWWAGAFDWGYFDAERMDYELGLRYGTCAKFMKEHNVKL